MSTRDLHLFSRLLGRGPIYDCLIYDLPEAAAVALLPLLGFFIKGPRALREVPMQTDFTAAVEECVVALAVLENPA